MRIAIVNLTGGGLSGGYKKYLLNILPRLSIDPSIEQVLCASPHRLPVTDWFGELPKVKFISCNPMGFLNSLTSLKDRPLQKALEQFNPHVLFVPLDRYIRFRDIPTVVMIRNMEPYVGSFGHDTLSEQIRKSIQAMLARRASKRADRVIAVSRFVRDFLVRQWEIDSERISLIYHGVELPKLDNRGEKPLFLPNDWQGRFIFSAGSVRPARGLEDLVDALVLSHRSGRDWPGILFAGETVPSMIGYRETLTRVLREAGAESRLIWAGSLNDAQMTWCYRNCQTFVMTSRVEACPNIAMEALAHGAVNVAANNPPLPEFFQSLATFYEPGDAASLVMAVDKALSTSATQRVQQTMQGRTRAKEFSWESTVGLTLEALKNAVAGAGITTERF